MLVLVNLLQLLLYIPLLALAGQGVLHLIAGPRRESNFFYKLLALIAKPFTLVVRKTTPRQVGDAQVPIVTFLLLLILYFIVSFERADLCISSGLVGQPGCR